MKSSSSVTSHVGRRASPDDAKGVRELLLSPETGTDWKQRWPLLANVDNATNLERALLQIMLLLYDLFHVYFLRSELSCVPVTVYEERTGRIVGFLSITSLPPVGYEEQFQNSYWLQIFVAEHLLERKVYTSVLCHS